MADPIDHNEQIFQRTARMEALRQRVQELEAETERLREERETLERTVRKLKAKKETLEERRGRPEQEGDISLAEGVRNSPSYAVFNRNAW